MKQFLFLLIPFSFIAACKKEPTINPKFVCYYTPAPDSTEVLQTLVGTWEWNFVLCTAFCTNDCFDGEIDKGLAITFKADSTLVLTKNDTILQSANFQLSKLDTNAYDITLTPRIGQIDEELSFCKNKIVFRPRGGTDWCTNFYERK